MGILGDLLDMLVGSPILETTKMERRVYPKSKDEPRQRRSSTRSDSYVSSSHDYSSSSYDSGSSSSDCGSSSSDGGGSCDGGGGGGSD